jgi:hypothetical protein
LFVSFQPNLIVKQRHRFRMPFRVLLNAYGSKLNQSLSSLCASLIVALESTAAPRDGCASAQS